METGKDLDGSSSDILHLANGSEGSLSKRLLGYGVETRGILPVPVEQRTDGQFSKIFFIWFSANFNILSFSSGTLGPLAFGLSARDSCLVILFFNLLCAIPPSYLATWGPKLGLRQMVQARYSFGYFGVIVPCVLNLITMIGFTTLNVILGGQTLASARSDGNLSWTVGIVIISLISLLFSFCGYKLLNRFERVAWIPVCITFIIALGIGGKHLSDPPTAAPASAIAVLSYGSVLAGYTITWSGLSSDFTSYMRPDAPSWRIFLYAYLGFLIPIVTLHCIGAVFAAATLANPLWQEGYLTGNVGGLLDAVLRPAGGFGKFLVVLLSLSVTGNVAITFYSISLNIQTFLPILLGVPRFVFSTVAAAIVIPLGILGAHSFHDTLLNFLSLIGYWATPFIAIVVSEHLIFRSPSSSSSPSSASSSNFSSSSRFSSYNLTHWDSPRHLPTGIPALLAGIAGVGVAVPCIHQVWFVGPIAEKTGDIGFEVAFVVAGLVYVPLRAVERRWALGRSGLDSGV